jgi:hypothetical protein
MNGLWTQATNRKTHDALSAFSAETQHHRFFAIRELDCLIPWAHLRAVADAAVPKYLQDIGTIAAAS